MDGNPNARTGAQVTVGDTVTFVHQSRTWTGMVVKKHRATAHVVCDHQRGFRVPYAFLSVSPGGVPPPVQSHTDHHRASFHSGARVQFVVHGRTVAGLLARLNPQRAHVLADDGREYRVSYAVLQQMEAHAATATTRTAEEIDAIALRARELLRHHHLSRWSFHFDNGRKRAGSCQYGTQVISVSYEFAQHAPEEELQDTLLHEIAHALVGKAHNHDEGWRAKAIEIGCSGKRCHELQFTPPRYIVHCERGCWVATAERRRRNVICTRCRGALVYQTYTEERWQRAQGAPREGAEDHVEGRKTGGRKI
jgi:predicted SprT family Zn-dependent metalloprotease